MDGFTQTQLLSLTTTQIGGFSTTQLSELVSTQIAGMSGTILSTLTTTQLGHFPAPRWAASAPPRSAS